MLNRGSSTKRISRLRGSATGSFGFSLILCLSAATPFPCCHFTKKYSFWRNIYNRTGLPREKSGDEQPARLVITACLSYLGRDRFRAVRGDRDEF